MKGKYERIAQIHIECIEKGFLSSLGTGFLAMLYQAIDEAENSTLIIAREQERIVGFAAGTLGIREVYQAMLKKKLRLFMTLLPSLFSWRKLARITETAFYGRKKPSGGIAHPSAELLSISVGREDRGKRHAERLYLDLVAFFRSKNIPRFKIIAGEGLAPAHGFYRKMGAMASGKIEVHKGEVSIMYIHEVS